MITEKNLAKISELKERIDLLERKIKIKHDIEILKEYQKILNELQKEINERLKKLQRELKELSEKNDY